MAKPSLVIAALLLACESLAVAQPAPPEPNRPLLVNVFDRHGNAVRDLTKENFRVKVNGHRVAIAEADYSLAPRRIVVLLDMSGSMAGQNDTKWRVASGAVEDLLAQPPSNVPIALLTFSDRVRDVFDFSQSRASMSAWLKDTSKRQSNELIHGKTALYDAVVAGAKMLEPHHLGDALYVITDGGDCCSQVARTAVEKLLLASGTRLFVFLLDEPLMDKEQNGKDSALDLAHVSGGSVFGVAGRQNALSRSFVYDWYDNGERTRETIKHHTQALNLQANGFYTLHLEVPIQPKKRGKVSLEIVDSGGRRRKDVAVTYPTALLPQDN